MKKLVLISSYCDSEEKRKVLKTNLELLRKIDTSILLYSPIHMGEDIINLVDFYFLNPNNPLGEDSSNIFWKEEFFQKKKIKFYRFWRNNRFAVFSQFEKLMEIAMILNYDINYFMLYDLVIDNQILNFIKSKNQESFFSFRATENGKELINDCATQFFSVLKNNLENLQSEFIWERCLDFNYIEHFWADLAQKINVPINRDFIVEDHIYTFRNWQEDFFNYSPWKEFKIYFSKNIGTTDPQHCLIYDVKQPVEIFVRIDNDIQKISIMEERQFEIKTNYQKFEFWRDGKIFDVLDKAEKFPGGGWEFL
jgi:hypothetical protein